MTQNRIRMNMNCVFIDTGHERILIETGIGEKWSAKHTQMFGITRQRPFADSLRAIAGVEPEDITIVINTHLHFDHAGGNTLLDGDGQRVSGVSQCALFCFARRSWNMRKHRPNETAPVTCPRIGSRSPKPANWN